jgi:Flavoprotein
MEVDIKQLVTEIISRLTLRMGADGHRGKVLVAISAASVGLAPAVDQLRQMVLGGYRLELAFSEHARALHRDWIGDQLAGFPFVTEIESDEWLGALAAAQAVVVPLLSLNTASKAALLIADTLPTNLILHGLAVGKPVIAAVNGAHPDERHWGAKGKRTSISPGLRLAVKHRLVTLQELGCRLVDVLRLNAELNDSFEGPDTSPTLGQPEDGSHVSARKVWRVRAHTITAGHVRHAHTRGADMELPPGAVVTPLARETAQRCRVALIPDRSKS